MKVATYVIYKQDSIWGLESTDHNYTELVRSQHSSRVKAISSLFRRYPHTDFFHLILPDNKDKKDFVFQLRNKKDFLWKHWEVSSVAYSTVYPSRAKALNRFFAEHFGIVLFYIVVPVGVEPTHGNTSKKSSSEQVAGSTSTSPNKGGK